MRTLRTFFPINIQVINTILFSVLYNRSLDLISLSLLMKFSLFINISLTSDSISQF